MRRAVSSVMRDRGIHPGAGAQPNLEEFSGQVANNADDAFQGKTDGVMYLNDLEVTLGHSYSSQGDQPIRSGVRLQGVTLAQGTPIAYAALRFTAAVTRSDGPVPLRIYGQKTANPSAFTATANDITGRTLTTAFVDWDVPAWSGEQKDGDTTTPDLASIVQELVDDASWAAGNAMVFLIEYQPAYAGTLMRNPWAHDAYPSRATQLLVNTSVEPDPDPGDPVTEGAYYMSTTGSDAGPGTYEQPWKTLRQASSVLVPGDTLYLRGGVYNEVDVNVYEATSSGPAGESIIFQGTEANPITVKSYPGERAVFDGFQHSYHPRSYGDGYSTFSPYALYLNEPEWLVLEDIDVRGSVGRGAKLELGKNVTVKGCRFYKNHADGLYSNAGDLLNDTTYEWEGGRSITIEDCDFFDNFDVATGGNAASGLKMPYNYDQTIRRCRFYNNSDDGMDFYGVRGPWLVEDCISFNNGYPDVTGANGNGMGYKLSGGADSSTTGHRYFEPMTFRRNISARNMAQGVMTNDQWAQDHEYTTAWMDGGDPDEYGGGNAIALTQEATKPAEDPDNSIMSSIGLVNDVAGGSDFTGAAAVVETLNSWQQSITLANVGFISTDPTNPDFLALASGSPCRGAGVDGTDLGALQFGERCSLDTSVLMDRIGGVDRVYE